MEIKDKITSQDFYDMRKSIKWKDIKYEPENQEGVYVWIEKE